MQWQPIGMQSRCQYVWDCLFKLARSYKYVTFANCNCNYHLRFLGTLSIFGLFLVIFVLFKCYRRRKRRQAVARDSLEQTEVKAAQDALEQRVEERFFHRQREMKLRHDMEMLGLSNDKGRWKYVYIYRYIDILYGLFNMRRWLLFRCRVLI